MLQPELIPLLTDSNRVLKTFDEGALLSRREDCCAEDDTPTPFSFTPQRIHLHKDHEFFEDGDIHRHLYLQNLSTSEADDKPKLSVSEFGCHISGCRQVFSSVEEYEHHYNSLHRHVCSSCRRSLPSAWLLDIHIQEWHDSLFTILAQRQDMYQCLVEGCGQKFRTNKQRKDHLIRIHKYPPDFRFDKAKKDKGPRETKSQQQQQKDTAMEAMEGVCESEGVCEVMCDTVSGQREEREAVEPCVSEAAGTVNSELSATNTSAEKLKPRYSYRVPATVCFGQGSVRGFRGRGRRK